MALSLCNSTVDKQGKELTIHGTPSFPMACYHDDLLAETIPWHWHEELEAGIVTEGEIIVAADSERHLLKAGDAFFVNASVLHTVWHGDTSASRIHSFVFHPRLVGGSLDSIFWTKYVGPLIHDPSLKLLTFDSRNNAPNDVRSIMQNAWQYCVDEPDGYEFRVRNELSRLLFHISNQYASLQKTPVEKDLRNGERIKLMLQYIHAHFSEEITTESIAGSALISASEALRCFHATIGMTPIQYVKQYRIQKAADYLLNTNLKVAEIGGLCGFQEMSYFARSFREVYGCSPTEYRKT